MFESEQDFAKNIDNLISHLSYEKSRGDFLKNIVKKYNCESAIKDEISGYVSDIERPFLINAKKFTYNNSIISLYGFLENFLENIVHEFVANINRRNIPFSLLPKEIKSSHLESSIDLLKKVQRSRMHEKGQKSTLIKSVISNMNSCVQEDEGYQLNEGAFSIHTSNFRYDTIHNIFCKVGVHGILKMALRNEGLKNAISRKHSIDSNIEQKIFVSLLTSELDDLAQRRNEISHGSFDGELESIEIVHEKALLLKYLGIAISQILTDHFFKLVFISSPMIELRKPNNTFNGMSVFGFTADPDHNNGESSEIKVGDMLFAKNDDSNDKLKYGKIISIVSNHVATESVRVPSIADFAIEVDFDFNAHIGNREIFVVTKA